MLTQNTEFSHLGPKLAEIDDKLESGMGMLCEIDFSARVYEMPRDGRPLNRVQMALSALKQTVEETRRKAS